MSKKMRTILVNIIRTPFFRNILLICSSISVILIAYHSFATIPAYTEFIIENTEDEARREARHLARMLLPGKTNLGSEQISDSLKNGFQPLQADHGIEKLKIFSNSGETLYSTHPEDIGQTNNKDYFHNFIAKGNVYSKHVKKDSDSADGERISSEVVEVYVPIMDGARFRGAFEIYYDITERKAAVDHLSMRSLTIMTLIVSGLLIGIVLSLIRASRAALANERAVAELNKARDELEEKVELRTSELRSANLTLRDEIVQRNEAVKRLQDSEARYRMLFEKAGDAIFILEAEGPEFGRIIAANQAAAAMHGYTIEELTTLSITDLDIEASTSVSSDRIARMLNGEWIKAIITHRRKDDTVFPVEISAGLVDYRNRRCILAFDRDITEKANADEEIRRNYEIQNVINRLLRLSLQPVPVETILQNALELILSVPYFGSNPKGIILLTNKRSKSLVMKASKGVSSEFADTCKEVPFEACINIQNAAFGQVVFSRDFDGTREIFVRDMRSNSRYAIPIMFAGEPLGVVIIYLENDHRRTQREERFLSAFADTLAGLIAREQTREEKDKIEIQLSQAQKMEAIGTLAGGIAHDFNNILSPILGFTELLKDDLPADHPFQANADVMLSSALRAKALVNQILAFSRRSESEAKPVKPQPIVKEAIELLRSSIPKTIKIEQSIDSECGLVNADPVKIHQIIMNLGTNAYHAMAETGGTLTVSLKQVRGEPELLDLPELLPGKYAHFTVADTGTGMTSDVLDKAFNPYFTTKEPGKGTGLGLSVVHGIVKEYGGDVRLVSKLGKGTTVNIYLPIIEGKIENRVDSGGPVPGGTERILLVDDEETVAVMEEQMLKRLGYQVTVRTGSIDAFEAFKANPDRYDLVVTDMAMPNMSGVQLAQQVKRIRSTVPVVICTGFSDQLSDDTCKTIGIQGYLMKPIVLRELAATVRQVLDTPRNTDRTIV